MPEEFKSDNANAVINTRINSSFAFTEKQDTKSLIEDIKSEERVDPKLKRSVSENIDNEKYHKDCIDITDSRLSDKRKSQVISISNELIVVPVNIEVRDQVQF